MRSRRVKTRSIYSQDGYEQFRVALALVNEALVFEKAGIVDLGELRLEMGFHLAQEV